MQADIAQALALEAILDRMLETLMAADLAALGPLCVAAEQALAGLSAMPDQDLAQRLQYKAQHNGLCLRAAARGVRAAQRRIAEIRAVEGGGIRLITYDGTGRRSEEGQAPAKVTRRV